jgi:uncharacterized membrane protein
MWILFMLVVLTSMVPAITALLCFEDSPDLPLLMRSPYKYYCCGIMLMGMLFFMLLCMEKQFKNEPKPKYEMVDQGHYYKMVPNNN